jgi:hypothetical protein
MIGKINAVHWASDGIGRSVSTVAWVGQWNAGLLVDDRVVVSEWLLNMVGRSLNMSVAAP